MSRLWRDILLARRLHSLIVARTHFKSAPRATSGAFNGLCQVDKVVAESYIWLPCPLPVVPRVNGARVSATSFGKMPPTAHRPLISWAHCDAYTGLRFTQAHYPCICYIVCECVGAWESPGPHLLSIIGASFAEHVSVKQTTTTRNTPDMRAIPDPSEHSLMGTRSEGGPQPTQRGRRG